jgi:hypothetical protein
MRLKHRGMLSPGVRVSQLKDPLTDPSRITRGLEGYTPQVHSCAPSGEGSGETRACPSLCLGLEGSPEIQAPNQRLPGPNPRLHLWSEPRAGLEPSALSAQDLGDPRCHPTGVVMSPTPSTKSSTRCDTKGQIPPPAPRAQGL